MKTKLTISIIRKAIWRFFSATFFYSICFILVTLLSLQLDAVQTFIADKVLLKVSEKTDHIITVDKVNISWLDRASLSEILILDKESDTLIYANRVLVNYRIWDLLNGDYLNIEEVISEGAVLQLIKHDSISKLNLSQFISSLKTDTVKKQIKPIQISFLKFNNLDLRFSDKTKKRNKGKVDFAHLNFEVPNYEMTDLEVRSDTITGSILQMNGIDRNSGFSIVDFNSDFELCKEFLKMNDLDFVTPTSHISDSLNFLYNGFDDFSTFVDSVYFVFHFDKTVISADDFELITGSSDLKSNLSLDGKIEGKVGDFNIENTIISFGDESFIEGEVSCSGLPKVEETFILAEIKKAHIVPHDIDDYVGRLSRNVRRLGRLDFTGNFAGFTKDFVAKGDFDTDLGSFKSDINLKIPDVASEMIYNGNLSLINANIGALIQNDLIETINLEASINGRGITKDNANFDLEAVAFKSGFKDYVYDSINASGHFASNSFEGTFSIHDPSCRLNGDAQIDLSKQLEVLNLEILIDSVQVDKLNLSKTPLFIKGAIDVKATDLELDDFTGYANLDSVLIIWADKDIYIDSVRMKASFIDSVRHISLLMPGVESEIKGEFKISDLLNDLPIVLNKYGAKLNLLSDTLVNNASDEEYKVELNAEFLDLSKYLDSLNIPVEMPNSASLEVNFRKSKNFNISTYFSTDYLKIKSAEIFNPSLEINASNDESSQNFLTNIIISSDRQTIKGVPETTDFLLEGVWSDDDIELITLLKQEKTSSDIHMKSKLKLFSDSIVLRMMPSEVVLFDERWSFNPNNRITILPKVTRLENLEIFDERELLSVSGIYSNSDSTSINFGAEDLKMNKISLFSSTKIDGFLNGSFRLFQDQSSDQFKFDGGFQIIQLELENLPVGNVIGSADWDPSRKLVSTKLDVIRDNFKSIQVKGRYFPLNESDQLDIDVTFDQADLVIGQPFLEENFSNIKGVANGNLKIGGTLRKPQMSGSCSVEEGGVRVNYLNTDYSFEGGVNFNSNQISFNNFNLTDRKGAQAQVTGYITHNYFKDLGADIQVRANDFEFLNTTLVDNSLYYGSVYGTGTVDIKGPFSDLLLKAAIKTEKNTRFFVPLTETSSITQEEYISFIDLSDTTQVVEEIKYRGLTLDFDIEVTPDAYCELIFDLKAGDIVRGRGRGNLKLTLDTDGEFDMFGPIELTDGAYNFTMASVISKEFDVVPGSTITWYGDPYNAILDLEATYLQRASFSDLSPSNDINANEASPSIPLLVVLYLDGGILSPEIDFELQLQDEGVGGRDEKGQLTLINEDDEELRNQVVSLLFLKRFSPKSDLFNQGSQGVDVSGSASEVLSGQLSYLLSQVDENLEIDVDLASLDKEAFNNLQLRLAYTFLDGRLKVTRGGAISNNSTSIDTEEENTNVLNDIVGDLSVEYSLTKDGKLRAKVFRTTQSLISTDDRIQETGVSLRFVHSFSDFKELLMIKRQESILIKKESIDEEEKQSSKDSIQFQN
ncbi:MAG: translocation/assembly module TamB domain-containing protein [Ekhidna sp.]